MKYPLENYPYRVDIAIPKGHWLGNDQEPINWEKYCKTEEEAAQAVLHAHQFNLSAAVYDRNLKLFIPSTSLS